MYIKGATMRAARFKPDFASSYYFITVPVASGKAIGPRVCCLLALQCALLVCYFIRRVPDAGTLGHISSEASMAALSTAPTPRHPPQLQGTRPNPRHPPSFQNTPAASWAAPCAGGSGKGAARSAATAPVLLATRCSPRPLRRYRAPGTSDTGPTIRGARKPGPGSGLPN